MCPEKNIYFYFSGSCTFNAAFYAKMLYRVSKKTLVKERLRGSSISVFLLTRMMLNHIIILAKKKQLLNGIFVRLNPLCQQYQNVWNGAESSHHNDQNCQFGLDSGLRKLVSQNITFLHIIMSRWSMMLSFRVMHVVSFLVFVVIFCVWFSFKVIFHT